MKFNELMDCATKESKLEDAIGVITNNIKILQFRVKCSYFLICLILLLGALHTGITH